MPFPPGATVYTFAPAGVAFVRVLSEGDTFTPWFFPETQYTADPVLGGTQVYLDIGGDSVATLTMRGLVLTDNDRAALKNARALTGVLSNTRPRTATATLVKASPIDGPTNQRWIDLLFVLRPA